MVSRVLAYAGVCSLGAFVGDVEHHGWRIYLSTAVLALGLAAVLDVVSDYRGRGGSRVLVNGRTSEGRTLVVYDADDPRDRRFVIDGVVAHVERAELFRDGGTRRYTTDRGVVTFPHRLMSDDRTPRLDGKLVT